MIEVTGLHKRYGQLHAVKGLEFTIATAEAFGLLGPNGAGKSTTIHMLVGALTPDEGRVVIDGAGDASEPAVRRHIGVAPQELAVYDELRGDENLAFFARIHGMRGAELRKRVDWALEFAGLSERRRDRVGTYSGGMKRRLNLACAAIHGPKILLCDEPTVGVDPQSRNHIFANIEALKAEGTTLLYTTHYMEEAERLCDRVAIIDHGELLALGTVDELIAAHGGDAVVEVELHELPEDPSQLPGQLTGDVLRVETDRPFEVAAELGKQLAVRRLKIERPDLERVFLHLTGRRLRDA
ncbi:MAG: ABC transporter ATP-binding protein [Nannocystaceae bacterium]|nr:ABC transporter ATP-binding protein [Myxococcales bacterium]